MGELLPCAIYWKIDRMQDFAQELPEPVKLYTDYHEMCRDPKIDAVFVGTPNPISFMYQLHWKPSATISSHGNQAIG